MLIAFIFPILLKAETKHEEDSKWFRCDNDKECIVIDGICSTSTSINRKYDKDAKEYYRWRGTADSCIEPQKQKVSPTSHCQSGICIVTK